MRNRKKEPKGTYDVGYCKPPAATQFKPGQSGNKKGRPKGETTVRGALTNELGRRRKVRVEGKDKTLTHAEIIAKQTTKLAMEGRPQALAQILKLETPLIAGSVLQGAGRAGAESALDAGPLSTTELEMMRWLLASRKGPETTSEEQDGEIVS